MYVHLHLHACTVFIKVARQLVYVFMTSEISQDTRNLTRIPTLISKNKLQDDLNLNTHINK
jgi:hypothetical protein